MSFSAWILVVAALPFAVLAVHYMVVYQWGLQSPYHAFTGFPTHIEPDL